MSSKCHVRVNFQLQFQFSFFIERCSKRHLSASATSTAEEEETKYRSKEMLQEFLIRLRGRYSSQAVHFIPPLWIDHK